MTVVAAVDCGTNTIKLLLGDPRAGGEGRVVRESRMVRLGQGVDATGRLSPEALTRAFAAIDEYAELVRQAGAERVRFCATSATRDAENAEEFRRGVRARLGVEPEVLSGEEEARLAFAGAVRGLAGTGRRAPGRAERSAGEPADPVLVIDIGGGSTELILGGVETGPTAACSMDIGSVRLHERRLGGDPPTAEQVAACVADVEAALDACSVDPGVAASVVGVAGTITTIAAGTLGLAAYDRDLIHGRALAVEDVHRTIEALVGMTVDDRRNLGYVHPGRVDVIDAGALILAAALRRTRVPRLVVAETDILDGIAWSLVEPV